MKVKFKISKTANLFFFISNLAEWHFSNDHQCNIKWIELTGPLNKQEISALDEIRPILKKYGFVYKNKDDIWRQNSQYLGNIFFIHNNKQAWEETKKLVSDGEFLIIKNSFTLFGPRFNKIWESHINHTRTLNCLKKSLNNANSQELYKELRNLFNIGLHNNSITAIILFTPFHNEETGAGTALNSNYITLNLPILNEKSWQFDYTIGVFFHEISHILFRNSGLEKKCFH